MKRWDGTDYGFFFGPGVVERASIAMDEGIK
jgi:hypothetical protein